MTDRDLQLKSVRLRKKLARRFHAGAGHTRRGAESYRCRLAAVSGLAATMTMPLTRSLQPTAAGPLVSVAARDSPLLGFVGAGLPGGCG
jgi:hypothetical protein